MTEQAQGQQQEQEQAAQQQANRPDRPGLLTVLALVFSYLAFFNIAVFISDTQLGKRDTVPAKPTGSLVLTSCEPNWLVLGARSRCTGTVTPVGDAPEKERYQAAYSRYGKDDVGRPLPVFQKGTFGEWRQHPRVEAPAVAEFFQYILILIAFFLVSAALRAWVRVLFRKNS